MPARRSSTCSRPTRSSALIPVLVPLPVRNVAWAGRFGAELVAEVARFAPDVVLYDSFAVIGRVVGAALAVPYVCVLSGHNMDPGRVVPAMAHDARVAVSEACVEALELLRSRHGWDDVSPSPITTRSARISTSAASRPRS